MKGLELQDYHTMNLQYSLKATKGSVIILLGYWRMVEPLEHGIQLDHSGYVLEANIRATLLLLASLPPPLNTSAIMHCFITGQQAVEMDHGLTPPKP